MISALSLYIRDDNGKPFSDEIIGDCLKMQNWSTAQNPVPPPNFVKAMRNHPNNVEYQNLYWEVSMTDSEGFKMRAEKVFQQWLKFGSRFMQGYVRLLLDCRFWWWRADCCVGWGLMEGWDRMLMGMVMWWMRGRVIEMMGTALEDRAICGGNSLEAYRRLSQRLYMVLYCMLAASIRPL